MIDFIMLNNNMIAEIRTVIMINQLVMDSGTLNPQLTMVVRLPPPLLLQFMEPTTMAAMVEDVVDVDSLLPDHQAVLVVMVPQVLMEKQEYLEEMGQTLRDPPPHLISTGALSVHQESQEDQEFKEGRVHQEDQGAADYRETKELQDFQDQWDQLDQKDDQEIQGFQEEKDFPESLSKLEDLKDHLEHLDYQGFLDFKENPEMMATQDVMELKENREKMEFQVPRVNRDQKDTQVQMEMQASQADATTALPREQLPDTNVIDGDLYNKTFICKISLLVNHYIIIRLVFPFSVHRPT